jgi:hypothetical protein
MTNFNEHNQISVKFYLKKITDIIGGISELRQIQSEFKITEGVPELPMAQIYWQSSKPIESDGNNRLTLNSFFRPPTIKTRVEFRVDFYIRQYGVWRQTVFNEERFVDRIADIFYNFEVENEFGVNSVKEMMYNIERVSFSETSYSGLRLNINLDLY